MPKVSTNLRTTRKPRFVTDEKGRKTSIILEITDYQNLLDYLEDLEDARDLLNAEIAATRFLPYEIYRKKFLKGKAS